MVARVWSFAATVQISIFLEPDGGSGVQGPSAKKGITEMPSGRS